MTTHRQVLALAAERIDFDLSVREEDALSHHVASCPACRATAAQLRADAVAVESRPRILPPPGMRQRFETIWLPRAAHADGRPIRLLLVLAGLLLIGASALAGLGGAQSQLAVPAVSPMPTPGGHMIGRQITLPLPAGAGFGDRACVTVELACASDITDAFGSVWTTALDAVLRLESDTGRVLARVPIAGHPIRLADDGQYLWVSVRAPASVIRIDPTTNAIEHVFALDGLPSGIAIGPGAAWLADEDARTLLGLDATDGHLVADVALPAAPWEVATTADRVWVTNRFADQLIEIDPETQRVVAIHAVPGAAPMSSWDYGDGVTTDGDMVLSASNSNVHRFDATTGSFTSALALNRGHLAIYQGRVWLLSSFNQVVQELDPTTLTPVAVQHVDLTITGGGGDWDAAITVTRDSVWIRAYSDAAVIRLDRNDRG